MRLPKTALWIGALLTATSAIRCGGETGEPSGAGSGGSTPPVSDAAAEELGHGGADQAGGAGGEQGGAAGTAGDPDGGSTGGFAGSSAGGFAGSTGGFAGNNAGGFAGSDAGGPGGNFPFDGGFVSRDGGKRDGGPRDGQAGIYDGGGEYCPAMMPVSSDPCWGPLTCTYLGQLCTCPHVAWGEASSWTCFTAPVTPDGSISKCPDADAGAAPHDGDACTLPGLSCRYGRQQCFCGGTRHADGAADSAAWNCR